MKKSIFLFFAAILCSMSISAAIPSKLYLDASGWGYSDARYAAYFMPQNSFVDMTKATGEVSVFEVAVPASQTKVIFVRMDGSKPANDWANKWNQTGDLNIPTNGENKFKPSGWDGATTTWSTYTYTPPTFYIAGDFVTPTWSANAAANKMDYADGVFSKSYDNVAASAHQFKITNGTWDNAVGYNSSTCSGTNCTVENGGGNIKFTPLAEGTVTITYTLADGKVHITCPEPPAAEYNITYPTTQTNYTLVAGAAKAQAGAEVSFTATPAEGYVLNVTYNGNAITGNNNVYTFMMPAADVTIAITAVAATTLYYVDNSNWGNANAYMWNDSGDNGWPGVAMTSAGTVGENNYAYYSISFAQGAYKSIIFNNGNGSKTGDLTINTTKPYFYDGTWYTWDELLAKLAAPVVTYDYYITGSFNGNNPKKAENGMTLDGEVYKATVTLVAGDNTLKVTDGTWDKTWGANELGAAYDEVSNPNDYNNIKITLAAEKEITVIFDATAGKITFEGLTEKAPEPTFDYYIVGSFNGDNPKKAENGMTLDGTVYKATVTLAAGDNTLKVTDGTWEKTWGANELGAAYEEVSNPNDYNNIKITLAAEAEKEITVIFDATAGKITFEGLTPYVAPLTYTVTVPAGTEKCYIAGNMNGWAFQEMEAVTGETNKFTITIVGAKETDAYKYACQADWAYAEVIDGGGNRTAWTELDEVTAWNKPAVVTYVLMGVGGWDQPGIELVQNPDPEKASEYMLTCQAIAATDAVKVVKCEDGAAVAWYGSVKDGVQVTVNNDADGNILLPAGTYNFYFDSSLDDKQLWIEAATYTRTATPGSFSTICLPYAGTISGATLFNLSDRDANYVYVVEAGIELEAGKPYVILPTAEEIVVTYKNYDYVTAGSYNALYGTYDEMNSDQLDGKYVITGDKYYYVDKLQSAGSKLLANRAYFNLNELPTAPASAPGARRIALGTNGQNTATGMENVDASAQPVKTIINGQLYILRGEKMYDAQGKLVK